MPTNVIKPGWVTFAGAGPGAPDLLTVRCRDAIAEADIIVYAGSLVNPKVLQNAAPGCSLHDSAGMDLPTIADLLISAARQGQRVLRLHTGDPSVYGAIAEQMEKLDRADIPYEVIPGVSAVFAAAAAVKTELTLPEVSQTLILTRRAGRTPIPKGEELESLAAHSATLALYLSISDMEGVTADLLRGGYPPQTPAVVVYRASWPDELVISGTLETIVEQIRHSGINRQAVILVGPSLNRKDAEPSRLYNPAFSHGYRASEENTSLPTSSLPSPVKTTPFCGRMAVYALTEVGGRLGKNIATAFNWDIFLSLRHCNPNGSDRNNIFPFDPTELAALIRENWSCYDGHLFIMASGIVVRKIAPFLSDKTQDPAVVVCDEKGRHVVSLVGGHIAGANRLATQVAEFLGGEAVISTATDIQGLQAFDNFAATRGMEILNPENIKKLNTLLLENREIAWIDPQPRVPEVFQKCENIVAFSSLETLPQGFAGAVVLSPSTPVKISALPVLYLRPLPLTVGIGCKRGTPAEEILAAIDQTLKTHELDRERVNVLASIELKKDESGLLEAAAARDWQTVFYGAKELEDIPVPTPSPFVRNTTGSPSVAEAAAIASSDGRLLVPKQKQGSVTVAVATLTAPSCGGKERKATGSLQVVGIGPGTLEGMTRQAFDAIRCADIIVGYTAYCEQIAPLIPGKKLITSGMREEIPRCDRALDLALAGHSVALVCSGDAGVYGMAGLLFERIEARSLDFNAVRVIPGVTAASLAASAVGAPLMNDFAVLSLSDLLTERETILRRLEHIARSGMACALYNPRSKSRQDLIITALDCFRRERGNDTIAAIVTHAGRDGESVWTGSLADLPIEKINMSSVVLIGGEEARLIGRWMVEPRGYKKKAAFQSDGEH